MIKFSNPLILYLVPFLIIILIIAYYRSARRPVSFILRFLSLSVIILALSDPYFSNKKYFDEKEVVALIDNSSSMTKEAIIDCSRQIDNSSSSNAKIIKYSFSDQITSEFITTINEKSVTDYERVFNDAIREYSGRNLIICTDGRETTGNVKNITKKIASSFNSLSIIFPSVQTLKKETIEISNVVLPLEAKSSDSIPLQFSLRNISNKTFNSKINILIDNKIFREIPTNLSNFQEKKVEINLDRLTKGEHKVTIKSIDGSSEKSRWIKISEPPQLLVISSKSSSSNLIEKILSTLKLDFKIIDPKELTFKNSTEEKEYSGIVLNNVRASDLSQSNLTNISKFVEDGNGLLILGGDSSFGLGGYQKTLLDKLSPLKSVPPRSKVARAPSAVMLVMDKSGSMSEQNKLQSAKLAVLSSIYSLKPDDFVGLIGFDYAPLSIIELDQVQKVRVTAKQRLANLSAYGQTNLLPALSLGRLRLSKINAGKKHLIVLSDGQFPAQSDSFVAEINRLRAEGITISTVALGYEADGPFMKMLAQAGKGSFYQTMDASTLPKLFVDDIKLAIGEDTMKEDDKFPVQFGSDAQNISRFGLPPDLLGFVETERKENTTLELTTSKSQAVFPLLASWKVGKGSVTAFASDLQSRWTGPWLRWNEFLSFWESIIRKSLKNEDHEINEKPFSLRYEIVGSMLKLEAFIYDQYLENSLGNNLNSEILLNGKLSEKFSLVEKAKGRFENTVNINEAGDYDLVLSLEKKKTFKLSVHANDLGEKVDGVNFDFLNNFSSQSGASLGKIEIKKEQKEKINLLRSKPIFLELLFLAIVLVFSEVFIRERKRRI